MKFSGTATSIRRAAPMLGEHTRELMRELGFSDADIDQHAARGDVILHDAG